MLDACSILFCKLFWSVVLAPIDNCNFPVFIGLSKLVVIISLSSICIIIFFSFVVFASSLFSALSVVSLFVVFSAVVSSLLLVSLVVLSVACVSSFGVSSDFTYFSLISSNFLLPSLLNSMSKYTVVPAVVPLLSEPYITLALFISLLSIKTSFVSLSIISNFPVELRSLMTLSVFSFSVSSIAIVPVCSSNLII